MRIEIEKGADCGAETDQAKKHTRKGDSGTHETCIHISYSHFFSLLVLVLAIVEQIQQQHVNWNYIFFTFGACSNVACYFYSFCYFRTRFESFPTRILRVCFCMKSLFLLCMYIICIWSAIVRLCKP